MDQVIELMKKGQANRAVGSHDMNEHSSRSHSIITVVCRGKNKIDGSSTYGLNFSVLVSKFTYLFSTCRQTSFN
jgi:hypothetical protein